MAYPNVEYWCALKDGHRVPPGADGKVYVLSVIDCGELVMPTGRLLACDPFAAMRKTGNRCVTVPPGRYPVRVTLADVSGAGDGSHMREAYATLLLDAGAEEVSRRIITPLADGPCPPEMTAEGDYYGFPVDAGTACFVDEGALAGGMPDEQDWLAGVFENDSPGCWFARMDDPAHIRAGLANIQLPLAEAGENPGSSSPEGGSANNILIIHSGWGDGVYPIVGGYDASGRLVRVHIDFLVVFRD
jgi:Protein of unknown function (DUF4241)